MFRFVFLLAGVIALGGPAVAQDTIDWKAILQVRLPLYGHRNWIVIADSAYPAQSANGIETIVANADHFQVLQTVLTDLERSRHVKPIVYLDAELRSLDENDAMGISAYRDQLAGALRDLSVHTMLHEQIISKLDEISRSFRVLIIKTNLTLPYTSVFLQLDCAYWSPEAERRLRSRLAVQPRK